MNNIIKIRKTRKSKGRIGLFKKVKLTDRKGIILCV